MKVLYDKDTRLPGWAFSATQGATKDAEGDGITFTIDAWKEGVDLWPRLLYTGPGVDLSSYTKIIYEIENTTDTAQAIVVAAKSVPEDNAGLAGQIPPKAVGQVILDISDGAPIDASNVREMFPYLYQPGSTVKYVLKKITAFKNPDYVSKRAALGLQIEEAKHSFAVLKKAVPNEPNAINALQVIQAGLDGLSREFEERKPGYIVLVQKELLAAQTGIARSGMDLRAADLWLWTSPLGMPIREGTLPSPADAALTSLRDTICLNQYKAICVNFSAAAKPQSVQLKLKGGQQGMFSLRPTLFAKARDGSMTADAIGTESSSLDLDIPAYQSQQVIVWVNTKKTTARAGDYKTALEVSLGHKPAMHQSIPINIKVAPVRLASSLPVSISNWAYFFMGSTKVTEGLEEEAVANLRDYGANTWNMDYTQVPMPVVDANGKYAGLEPATLKRLTQLMDLLKGKPEEIFVIWLGFQRAEIREALAKPGVLEGYIKDLHRVLDDYKVGLDKRYIMLWDEPRLPELRESVDWMKKIRKIDASFKFYDDGTAIPTDKQELDEFLKITDRWFPNWDQLFVARPEEAKKLADRNLPGMGIYRCLMSRNNRGVNIYEYYRFMGWYTMQYGFETLAFWAHNVGTEEAWDGTTGTSSGGIVVYQKDGKLYSSRRWELFREGLDDYKLAQAAFNTRGILEPAKLPRLAELCRAVTSRPNDAGQADKVRGQMIALALKNKPAATRKPAAKIAKTK